MFASPTFRLQQLPLLPPPPPQGRRGGHNPRTFENRGGQTPQKFGYFSIFFLKTYEILHFLTFSR